MGHKLKRKSCKKRKLEYIRVKNKLREGMLMNFTAKISSDCDIDSLSEIVDSYVCELKAKYKLPIQKKIIKIGLLDGDFAEGTKTALLKVGI